MLPFVKIQKLKLLVKFTLYQHYNKVIGKNLSFYLTLDFSLRVREEFDCLEFCCKKFHFKLEKSRQKLLANGNLKNIKREQSFEPPRSIDCGSSKIDPF